MYKHGLYGFILFYADISKVCCKPEISLIERAKMIVQDWSFFPDVLDCNIGNNKYNGMVAMHTNSLMIHHILLLS